MAEVDAETRSRQLNVNKEQQTSNENIAHDGAEVDVRSSQNDGIDADETDGKCYACRVFCSTCSRQCMTKHHPLPSNPTRFDVVIFVRSCIVCTNWIAEAVVELPLQHSAKSH